MGCYNIKNMTKIQKDSSLVLEYPHNKGYSKAIKKGDNCSWNNLGKKVARSPI